MCESCKKPAGDYQRIVNLAKKQADIEKEIYIVYQKIDGSYGYNKEEFVPENNIGRQFTAIPIN